MAKFTKIYYTQSFITTIKQLFDVQKIVNLKVEDFLNQKDPYGEVTNRDALFEAYTEQQKTDLGLSTSSDIKEETPIYPPAVLYIPIDNATVNVIKNESQFVQNVDFDFFLSEAQKNIVNSNDYIKPTVIKSYPEISVWMWCKSVEPQQSYSTHIQGSIINITDFIEDLKISVSETGGNFQITTPIIPAIFSQNSADNLKKSSTVRFDVSKSKTYNNTGINEKVVTIGLHDGISSIASPISNINLQRERVLNMAHVGMNVNDIVFIKFERLKVETNQFVNDLYVDPAALNNEVFDLIGLIDSIDVQTDSGNITNSISGRDLMKLIIDDGTFFFPNSFSDPDAQKGVFQNIDESKGDGVSAFNNLIRTEGGSAGRFIETGLIMPFFIPSARTVGNIASLLVKTLSNIEICPDSLFDYYGDKRTMYKKENKTKK